MIGSCKLCLAIDVTLRDSHIMPKWSYRRARANGPGGDPVHISDGRAFQTSEQKTEYLLCAACEQRLGKVEARVAALLPKAEAAAATAPLLDMVGLWAGSGDGYRQVPLNKVSKDDLAYFAASVFWRASVSSLYAMTLELSVAETMREYLLERAPFPSGVALVAVFFDLPFAGEHDVSSTCFDPQAAADDGTSKSYRFLVNGLYFHLEVGRSPEAIVEQHCLLRTNSMFLARQEALVEMFAEPMLQVQVVDKLRQRFECRRAPE